MIICLLDCELFAENTSHNYRTIVRHLRKSYRYTLLCNDDRKVLQNITGGGGRGRATTTQTSDGNFHVKSQMDGGKRRLHGEWYRTSADFSLFSNQPWIVMPSRVGMYMSSYMIFRSNGLRKPVPKIELGCAHKISIAGRNFFFEGRRGLSEKIRH